MSEIEREEDPISLQFTDIALASKQAPFWVIEDLIPAGLTIIGGPPKSGKSTWTVGMAALVAGFNCKAFPSFLSVVKHGGPVQMLSAEATAGELRDIAETGLRVKLEAREAIMIADDPCAWRLDRADCSAKLLDWLHLHDPRLLIIDPLRDFHDLDENDSGEMMNMLRPLRQWAVEVESSVTIVHHARKPSEGGTTYEAHDMRGSGAIFGKADAVLMLTPQGDNRCKVHATFKRAKSWTRTIQLSAWDYHGAAFEPLLQNDHTVLAALEKGLSIEAVIRQGGLTRKVVQECVEKLQRNGLLA